MKLYLDANVIIYGYEAEQPFRSQVTRRLWQLCSEDGYSLVTSAFSVLECRVVPLRNQNRELLAAYDDFFSGDGVEVVDVSRDVLDLATELRVEYGFKSPDAVHLASAIHVQADLFMKGDAALRKCKRIAVEIVSHAAPN